ncbi:MAG: hypothetical protein NTV92_03685 [Candidatus Bipolaricaulota bacterium]|nr:hypothetical protein [Candidatus Bipolaricaulota bacterium]
MKPSIVIGIAALVAAAALAVGLSLAAGPSGAADEIRATLIPAVGTETQYGTALSLQSLPQFIGWWTTLVPAARSDARYADALNALVAPCCNDNPAFHCCCETQPGQACNLIRSAQGLAAHLVLDLDYSTEQVRGAVLQWLEFARPDYYVAAELATRGLLPATYGLTTQGSCYRGLCGDPISQGGCGGMDELIEPAIAGGSA